MSTIVSSETDAPASPPAVFLSCEDYSARTGVRLRTVRGWCRRGKLPAVRPGKAWLIPARSLVALEAQAAAQARGRRQAGGA